MSTISVIDILQNTVKSSELPDENFHHLLFRPGAAGCLP